MSSVSSDTILMSFQNNNVDDDGTHVNGMVDYAGRPAKRSQSGYWRSACYIIGVGAAERFAYYGISSNLITYLTGPLGQPTAASAASINIWTGTGSLIPLFGAFVAESFLGRYRTIVLSSLLYILALGLLTTSALLNYQGVSTIKSRSPSQLELLFFFVSLYLMALGQGTLKPCLLAFGADQFDEQDPEELRSRSSFFNWWYFGLCAGPLAALLVLNYIQDNVSWGLGFGIPCISMAFALILFVLETNSYRYSIKGDEKCALVRVSQVFIKATTNRRAVPSKSIYNEEEHEKVPSHVLSNSSKKFRIQLRENPEPHDKWIRLSQLGFTLIIEHVIRLSCDVNANAIGFGQTRFLNKALLARDGSATGDEEVCTTHEIEEAKALLNLVPIWVTSLAFAICLAQPPTLFTEQGITMDRSIGSSFDVPAASLQYIIGVTIILFIPIYDRVFVPLARTLTGTHSGITKLQRIGIGMSLCTLSMITAALVERKRLKTASASGLLDVPKAKVPMSFWWLIPQYIVYGVADVFTLIGLQELFYDEMPCGLKSVGLSIYISICGVGNFLSSFLICIIQRITTSEDGEGGWFSDNMNRVHLDYFYWLLAGLNALGLLAFLYFARSFKCT